MGATEIFMTAVAVAVSAVQEGLPVVSLDIPGAVLLEPVSVREPRGRLTRQLSVVY